MDITTSVALGRLIVTIKRRLFTSGTQSLDVKVVDPDATPGGGIVGSYASSRDYTTSLIQMMGLENHEEVEFILSALIADEERHTVVWNRNCDRISLKLLVPTENYVQLRWLEREIERKQIELGKASDASKALGQRLDRQIAVRQFLQAEMERLRSSEPQDILQKFHELQTRHDETVNQLQLLEQENVEALDEKSTQLMDLSGLQAEKQSMISRIDELKTQKYNTILRVTDPEDVHVIKHMIHARRCPFCDADMASEIQGRETQHLCILCGNQIQSPNIKGIPELNKQVDSEEAGFKTLLVRIDEITSGIGSLDRKRAELATKITSVRSIQKDLALQISEMKKVGDLRQRIEIVNESLTTIGQRITFDTSDYDRLEKLVTGFNAELSEIESLLRKGEEVARNRSREVFSKVATRYSEFARLATNGELDVRLGSDMVPSLEGRKIYSKDDASQFERTILDIGFRVALLSTFAEQRGQTPFLVLETPDETCDESYLEYFAHALRTFASNICLLVTSSSTEFMRMLLKDCPASEKRLRLVDLSGTGTSTQKSYYSPLITEWFGT
jgi:hypothetical protein